MRSLSLYLPVLGLFVGCIDLSGPDPEPRIERPDRSMGTPDEEPGTPAEPDEVAPPRDTPEREPGFTMPADCKTEPEVWRSVRRVQQVVEASVHELVTCGAAQMGVVNTLIARVLLSNDQLFAEATLEELTELLGFLGLGGDVGFEHQGVDWVMGINEASDFRIRFYKSRGQAIEDNVFEMSTYLVGAEIETSHSWAEMKANLELKNTYTLTWERLGPLGGMMFPDGEPRGRRVVLELSLIDFAYLLGIDLGTHPEFGPFERLADTQIDSDVNLVDQRDGVDVAYTFHGARGELRSLIDAGALTFEFKGLEATDGVVDYEADAAELRYLRRGTLAGFLSYTVRDPEGEPRWTVVDDFGDGAGYPESSVECFKAPLSE